MRNPPLLPLVPLSATLATTPQPNRVSIAVPNTSDKKTIPRDIFDSSIFCCRPVASLKGRWAGSMFVLPASHCARRRGGPRTASPPPQPLRRPPGRTAQCLHPGLPLPGTQVISGDQAVDPDAVEPLKHLL